MKEASKNWSKLGMRALGVVPLGLLAFACGGLLGEPTVGGESSFLRICTGQCADGFECISNVCTQSCLMSKDTCGRISEQAICTNASIEAGNVAVCDVACTGNGDCSSLGTGFHCDAGFCRGSSIGTPNGQGGGTGVAGSAAVGGSVSTTGGSSGLGGSIAATGGAPGTTGVGGVAAPMTGAAGAAPGTASCRVAYQEYPSGTRGIPFYDGTCSSCTCTDGKLNCAKVDCPLGSPVVPCPADLKTDAIQELLPLIAGDTLSINVEHSGGCRTHDYALCYEQRIGESLPPYLWLHVIHDGHGDSCEALLANSLQFDLSPLARYVNVLSPSDSLVRTAYGLYVFGNTATCDERTSAARDQMTRSLALASKACTTKTDCQIYTPSPSCYPTCGTVMSNSPHATTNALSMNQLNQRVAALDAGQCAQVAEMQCPIPVLDCAALVPDCVNGQCVDTSQVQ